MNKVESLVIINQRQWGIIAPQKDVRKVDKLATCGLYTCYGFSLFDLDNQVGVLAHLDSPDQVIETAVQAAQFFRSLGAKEISVRTANLKALSLEPLLRSRTIKLRELKVTAAIKELQERGVNVNPEWQDIGEYENVIFDAKSGLRAAEFTELGISYEQNLGITLHYARLLQLSNSGQLDSKPISCKYIPELLSFIQF